MGEVAGRHHPDTLAARPGGEVLEIEIPAGRPRILDPGDRIFLRGKELFPGTLSLTINGTNDKPVLITSYENENGNAVIDGGNKEAIILHGNHFQLKDINVKGSGRKTGNTTNGITLSGAGDGVVENIKTEGFQKSGIELNSCKNISLKNVYAVDNGLCGIYITGSKEDRAKNILVKDCKAENNPGDPTMLENHSGNGILAGWSDSVVIDHCVATNNGWDMPRIGNGPVGIWAYESNAVTIQYCISYRNKTSKGGKDGGGFDLDGGVRVWPARRSCARRPASPSGGRPSGCRRAPPASTGARSPEPRTS
jgi:hypothetical protein